MHRTLVLTRHTFFEAVSQPIYALLLAVGAAVLAIFAGLPFFTLGEDATMYKAVGLDVILVLVLLATLFAASRSVHEEIEDRTMLTLMSKPVARWEVLLGKYLGIVLSALLAVAALGVVLTLCLWLRVPTDHLLNPRSISPTELEQIRTWRATHLAGVFPQLALTWLQVAVLAAVSVAISTRVSLVVNLPVVLLIYLAGNLTRFLDPATAGRGPVARAVAYVLGTFLPFLQVFDLRSRTVYARVALTGTPWETDPTAASLAGMWAYVAVASAYAAAYALFALLLGMLLFRTRELGGSEG